MGRINIKDYIVGHKYTREEIIVSFKVSGQSGMMRSHSTNTLVLISNRSKALYSNEWHGGIMHYTGMGTTGDQSLSFGQNKTLLESNINGVTVHFFEIFENTLKRKYVYVGIVKLIGKPFIAKQPDANKEVRNVWIFPLRAIEGPETKFIDEIFEIDTAASVIIHDALESEGINLDEVSLIETIRPEGSNKPTYKRQSISGRKTDFLQKSKRDAAIGLRGEELVVLYEKNHLKDLGLDDLASQVKWVAKEADGYGYDVLSFDEDGLEKYI